MLMKMSYVDYYMHLLDRSMNVASTYKPPPPQKKNQPPDIWAKVLKLVRFSSIESLK